MTKIHPILTVYDNYDPTRTLTLRNQFASEMAKRFRALRGLIRKAIVDQDCFGLLNQDTVFTFASKMELPGRRAFNFRTSGEKIQGFMDWLHIQTKNGILELHDYAQVGKGIEEAWTNKFIHSGYQKGIFKARGELTKAGHPVPSIKATGGIDLALNQPFHMDRLGILYTRTFNDLKGITDAMSGQISRVLAQGMADGKNPMALAKSLTRVISGPDAGLGLTDILGRFMPAERRAKILARTEIIRAHHVATIQEYRNWGVEGVTVQAEWQTAGDGRVCDICASLQGSIYTLDQIEPMIPIHPQCRCVALPVDITYPTNNRTR